MLMEKERHFEDLEEKYGSNSAAGVVICSGERESKGIIKNSNFEIENILGHKTENIKGESINRLIPSEMIRKKHEQLLLKYLMHPEVIKTQRHTLALSKSGYIVPVQILRSMIPTITESVQLICFLRPSKFLDDMYSEELFHENSMSVETTPLFLIDKKLRIHGFTTALKNFCNIKEDENEEEYENIKNNHQNREGGAKILDFQTLYPDLFIEENYMQLRMGGLICKSFDITPLRNILLMEFFNSSSQYENQHITDNNIKSEVIIKIKETKIEVNTGSYLQFGILTIHLIDEGTFLFDEEAKLQALQSKPSEIIELAERFSSGSVASSIYIYIYIYIV